MIFMSEAVAGLIKGFVEGAIHTETRPGWRSELSKERKFFSIEKKVNDKGRFMRIDEKMEDGRRQIICLPEGRNRQGWVAVAEVLQEYEERCWLKKEKLKGLGVEKKFQESEERKGIQEVTIEGADGVPKFAMGGGKEDWSKMMTVTAKKVRDWKRILNDVMIRIPNVDLAVIIPFDDSKAVLNIGNSKAELMTVETS
uniref:Uncharacterized protein n=1 Tax=Nelumbo nucifera TaxID=4432 RepID=A0A822YUR7_NELNU|nr:TPA_asm: hypothetical protein HUJ06_006937 [Nelumbo nucifera]